MTETSTVERLLQQWIDAFNSRDLDRHMALYEEDATLVRLGRRAARWP